ncbi:uncharacterized protein LOC126836789 [Adelges cooleyi]|uniref:uncharacterized protein LOC126836789 n=1 Tax=Adelges cooleyi TaxID=133065 RepID=UPI0021804769|nr:uncharacterized protein LOC126836789 [Adelges cooleyi]
MVANIFAFILCCFAITSNIKSIESTGNSKFEVPVQYKKHYLLNIIIYEEPYVYEVNRLRTFKKDTIIIESNEENILSKHLYSDKDMQLKIESLGKFENKIQDIQCSYCVVTKLHILYLKNLAEKLKSGVRLTNNEEIVTGLEKEAKYILRILLMSNLEIGKWLWIFLLKIVAISQYGDNIIPFIRENPFVDDQLQSGVTSVIEKCMAEKYLPPTAMEYDFISKNYNTYDYMFHHLYDPTIIDDIFHNHVLGVIEFLYLKPFWLSNQLLFREMEEVNIDWGETKQRFELEVVITKEFVDNRIWMYHPYRRLDHQYLFVKIIDARIYCYLTVVLHVYEQQLFMLDEQALTDIKSRITKVMIEALKLTAYKDDFLVVLSSELKFGKINVNHIDWINDILARVRTKANGILNDLNGASSNEIDRLSFNHDENQLPTYDMIIKIIDDFEDYLKELKSFLPFDYKVLLNFIGEYPYSRLLSRVRLY